MDPGVNTFTPQLGIRRVLRDRPGEGESVRHGQRRAPTEMRVGGADNVADRVYARWRGRTQRPEHVAQPVHDHDVRDRLGDRGVGPGRAEGNHAHGCVEGGHCAQARQRAVLRQMHERDGEGPGVLGEDQERVAVTLLDPDHSTVDRTWRPPRPQQVSP